MLDDEPTPVCAFAVSLDGVPKAVSLPVDSQNLTKKSSYTWLHFDANEPASESWLARQLPLTIAKALVEPQTRPRCDRVDGGVIVNLREANMNPGATADDMVSVRLWVTDGLIISAGIRKIWALDTIRLGMDAGIAPASVSVFLAELANGLTLRIEKVSLNLLEETDVLEEYSISPTETLATELAGLRQSVIKLRRFVRPQSEALAELSSGQALPLDRHCRSILRETFNRSVRTVEELDAVSDRLQAIQDHLDMIHTLALTRNSYVLSVVAAIFLPLGFLASLFGINVGGMPGVDAVYGFWVVAGGSVFIGFVLFFVFRHLKWL